MTSAVCRVAAVALTGLRGTTVLVEAAVSNQLPGMAIIGLPDAALAEAKQRVRLATQQMGLALSDRFIVVNLSPAALPKQGSGFDLAIALAALAASGHVQPDGLEAIAHIGELSLDGELRRPPGLLSAVLAARERGFARVMVPAQGAREAALVPGIDIVAARDLRDAVAWHRRSTAAWVSERTTSGTLVSAAFALDRLVAESRASDVSEQRPDMAEVIGQPEAVEALLVAAAGRHHVSMIGPPGAGKTLLATRLPSILPDLSPDESIVASSIASLGGAGLSELVRRPPFESPHHTSSAVSIIGGGGTGLVRPGAVTRACFGVLFLDEAPEFPRAVLDALRQPLESGEIEIHRARVRATLPAQVQLVLAANPCPCGNAYSVEATQPCTCTPSTRVRYLNRLSGPLTDRIDVRLQVHRVSSVVQQAVAHVTPPTSAELREQVRVARAAMADRLAGTPWKVNAEVPGHWLRGSSCALPKSATAVLDHALSRGSLTLRGYDRALRLAWTLADIAGKDRPGRDELAHALALRGGMN